MFFPVKSCKSCNYRPRRGWTIRGCGSRRQGGGAGTASASAGNDSGPTHQFPPMAMAANHFLREGFRYSRMGYQMDKWSRVLFPVFFALFNAYYWGYYLWWLHLVHGVDSH